MSKSSTNTIKTPKGGTMTKRQAVFIGVGAMVGAGIFSLLGEAGTIALSAVWVSFLLAGVIALLQGYSFTKLGKKYASPAGLMGYISAGFGTKNRISTIAPWLVWASSIVVVSMVAVTFGTFAASVITGGDMPNMLVKVMATLIIVGVVLLSSLGGSAAVAKIGSTIVKLVIVVLFGLAVITLFNANWSLLAPSTYPPMGAIVGSIALTFFAYLGFGVVSYTAKDLKNANDLGPATYGALAIAILLYIAISLGVFGTLTPKEVADAGPTAIALAAKPILGMAGYVIVSITAMLSTAGAVNSSLYPMTGLLDSLAKSGIFPPFFGKRWGKFSAGLVITAILVLIPVWGFDISAIAAVGSAVALTVFLLISMGHLKIREETGAKVSILALGALTIVATLVAFLLNTWKTDKVTIWAFIGIIVIGIVADTIWRAYKNSNTSAKRSV